MDECERESRETGAGVSRESAPAAVRGRDSQAQALLDTLVRMLLSRDEAARCLFTTCDGTDR